MTKRKLIKPEETVPEMPSLSTDATAAIPEEQTLTLHIRTRIRAGVGTDWQDLLGASESDSSSV